MKELHMVFDGKYKRVEKTIKQGQEAYIGRINGYSIGIKIDGKESVLDIPQDSTVSRMPHAKIFWKTGVPFIQDLGSKRGTKIDGMIIPNWRKHKESDAIPLANGSKILFGSMTYCSVESEKNTLTLAEGDSFHLTKEEMEAVMKHTGIEVKANKGERIIENVEKDVKLNVEGTELNLDANLYERNLVGIYVCLMYVKDSMERDDLNSAIPPWNILEKDLKNTLIKFDEQFYNIMKRDMDECRQNGELISVHRSSMIDEINRIRLRLEKAMVWK